MILNNGYMGMVRQWQELLHGSAFAKHPRGATRHRQAGRGLRRHRPARRPPADLDAAIAKMIATPGPVLMDVHVDPSENCFPMIPSGATHDNMLLGELVGGRGPQGHRAGKGLV
jgi:acetolactate synthase-1/2/3 large subunit